MKRYGGSIGCADGATEELVTKVVTLDLKRCKTGRQGWLRDPLPLRTKGPSVASVTLPSEQKLCVPYGPQPAGTAATASRSISSLPRDSEMWNCSSLRPAGTHPGVVIHACTTRIWGVEAGRSRV